MGVAARVAQPALRVFQVICSAIVLGILGHFLHELQQAGVSRDGRIIYGVVVGSISLAFALIFVLPMMYSFLAFPGDFILFVMWLVLFCLLISRTGTHTCGSPWFYNYWRFYWGGWWRRPFVPGVVSSGCSSWRTSLAFSFLAMLAFLVTTILGAFMVARQYTKRRTERQAGTGAATDHPQTSQIGGPAPAGRGVVGGGTNHTATATAPGAAPTAQTTQPGGTYV